MVPDNDNPPAFPRPASIDRTDGTLPDGDRVVPESDGMSLRDYFAGQVIAGYCRTTVAGHPVPTAADAAEFAYKVADAMLARRVKN